MVTYSDILDSYHFSLEFHREENFCFEKQNAALYKEIYVSLAMERKL